MRHIFKSASYRRHNEIRTLLFSGLHGCLVRLEVLRKERSRRWAGEAKPRFGGGCFFSTPALAIAATARHKRACFTSMN
jgi:hypothetical protein